MRASAISLEKAHKGRMAFEAGLAAEERIVMDYQSRGFVVVDRRWRGRSGEIDLVAKDGAGFIFVEVKQSRSFDRALHNLTEQQVARLFSTADEYLAKKDLGSMTDVRFDVALVDQQGAFRILQNAFA
ncbi:MAG: YraN family protein [Paracoccaceae bacterium]